MTRCAPEETTRRQICVYRATKSGRGSGVTFDQQGVRTTPGGCHPPPGRVAREAITKDAAAGTPPPQRGAKKPAGRGGVTRCAPEETTRRQIYVYRATKSGRGSGVTFDQQGVRTTPGGCHPPPGRVAREAITKDAAAGTPPPQRGAKKTSRAGRGDEVRPGGNNAPSNLRLQRDQVWSRLRGHVPSTRRSHHTRRMSPSPREGRPRSNHERRGSWYTAHSTRRQKTSRAGRGDEVRSGGNDAPSNLRLPRDQVWSRLRGHVRSTRRSHHTRRMSPSPREGRPRSNHERRSSWYPAHSTRRQKTSRAGRGDEVRSGGNDAPSNLPRDQVWSRLRGHVRSTRRSHHTRRMSPSLWEGRPRSNHERRSSWYTAHSTRRQKTSRAGRGDEVRPGGNNAPSNLRLPRDQVWSRLQPPGSHDWLAGRAWSVTRTDGVCQLRWANQKGSLTVSVRLPWIFMTTI